MSTTTKNDRIDELKDRVATLVGQRDDARSEAQAFRYASRWMAGQLFTAWRQIADLTRRLDELQDAPDRDLAERSGTPLKDTEVSA